MRAVHDLLPPKIPDVRLHIIAVDLHWPFGDLDAGRAFEFFVFVGDEAMNECGFSDAAAAYEDELEFIEGAGGGCVSMRSDVIVENSLCIQRLNNLAWQSQCRISRQMEV